ncbi:hypothetical protein N0V90_006149 [Kalmusia sp. IMI 367209]|nr:hypothetical protein N0V90_006149 [Kalmusia sp. IMI 367209]
MNLIAYSDSEDSGDDAPQAPKPAAKPAPKASFQKVVDRSNPGKIKLNLPGASQLRTDKDDVESEAPPAKKARTGGGAFGGFNAMLPAPKKSKMDMTAVEANSGKRGLGKGLGAGVNLKTGAEPAFRREPRVDLDAYDENGNPVKREARKQEDFRALLNLPLPKSETEAKEAPKSTPIDTAATPEPAAKPVARPRFMPMSMAREMRKKKPTAAKPPVTLSEGTSTVPAVKAVSSTIAAEQKPPSKPRVSLFSISQEVDVPQKQSTNEYQPLIYGADQDDDAPIPDSAFTFHQQTSTPSTTTYPPPPSNDLTNIASELNLSEAERRQLFGRKGQGPDLSSAKIVDFNTDAEYAHNEMLRQRGETVQHNALKSISGTGKNSLRSLINVAATQKDALEEHFASSRRNKKEAGNKYGW